MGKYFHNENSGLSVQDPDYNEDYDLDDAYERYLQAMENKEESEKGN